MRITKFGHCCLLLDIDGVKILTDPGSFTTEQNTVTGLGAVLITHSHQDHFHAESVPHLAKNNPEAIFVTNGEVGKLLEAQSVAYTKVGDGESADIKGVKVEGFGTRHAEIYGDMGQVENTGYFVGREILLSGRQLL